MSSNSTHLTRWEHRKRTNRCRKKGSFQVFSASMCFAVVPCPSRFTAPLSVVRGYGGLGMRLPPLSWLRDGVSSSAPALPQSAYVPLWLAVLSLFFSLFHLTLLSVSPSLPPSCSIPPIPLPHSLSPPLRHPGCCLKSCPSPFFVLESYVSPLTLMCGCFSPGHFVLLAGNDRTSTGAWLATAQPTGEPGRCVALSAAVRSLALLGAHTSWFCYISPWLTYSLSLR